MVVSLAVPLSVPLSSSPSVCLSVLPRSGVFSLFAGSLLVPFQLSLSLSPPPAPPAGQDDDEEDDYARDPAPDGQGQLEKLREGGWERNTTFDDGLMCVHE